jgi:hypothetical protein
MITHEMKPWNYICILSTILVNKPMKVYIHIINNISFDLSYHHAFAIIEIISVSYSVPFKYKHIRHLYDYYILCILRQYGGLYIAVDMLAIKPIGEILYKGITCMSLYIQKGYLSNNFIYTEKKCDFINEWIYYYKQYDNISRSKWNFHNTIYPYILTSHYNVSISHEYATSYPYWHNVLDVLFNPQFDQDIISLCYYINLREIYTEPMLYKSIKSPKELIPQNLFQKLIEPYYSQ